MAYLEKVLFDNGLLQIIERVHDDGRREQIKTMREVVTWPAANTYTAVSDFEKRTLPWLTRLFCWVRR